MNTLKVEIIVPDWVNWIAVDGYDYESGEEYGLRSAIIAIEELKQ